jgi:hypothetical protein
MQGTRELQRKRKKRKGNRGLTTETETPRRHGETSTLWADQRWA